MAISFTPDQSGDSALNVALASGVYILVGTLTFSGSYSTGGDSFDIEKCFGSGGSLRRVVTLGNPLGFGFSYDKTNKKLKVFNVTAAQTTVEHTASAYDSDLTAAPLDIGFLVKYG
jgi:hypothetical protein